jgi:diguanylate cyclase (GGDEF)-like protein
MKPIGEQQLPPSEVAARRAGSLSAERRKGGDGLRAYPPAAVDVDAEAIVARLAATRALLGAQTPEEVAGILATLVRDLGGELMPARLAAQAGVLPLDVSLGLTEPLLPWCEPASVSAMRIATVIPSFLEDARAVADGLEASDRLSFEAERDALTGLLPRRAWMRRLAAADQGDSVCLIDLDHFKAVNDRLGHGAGDEVLRAAAELLRAAFRRTDHCGRFGGDELVCLAPQLAADATAVRFEIARQDWERQRPAAAAGVGFSVGIAVVGAPGPRAALDAADRALYRAKAAGRNRTEIDAPAQEGSAA